MIPLPLLLGNWQKYLIIAAAIAALCAMSYIKGCSDEKIKSEAFRAKVELLGEQAKQKAKEQEAKDKLKKEQADSENKVSSDRIATLSRQLRDERSRTRYLPAPAPGSASPDRISFDRAELERAIQFLDGEVSGLFAEGDKAIVDLNTARRWAKP